MTSKYRCPRCRATFDDPCEADRHGHTGGPPPDPIREVDVRVVETQQTGVTDWSARAFHVAGTLEEAADD